MQHLWGIISNAYSGYWNYLFNEILNPHWHNYFYWLIFISLACWLLELAVPWRQKQGAIRRDFWLDGFYMFFNFFLFSLIIYNALSSVVVDLFNTFLAQVFGINNLVAIRVNSLPFWGQWLVLFVVRDFIQWNVHRLLHRVNGLWEVHKIHHSVQEMGFAAHLRYHWGETIVYRTIEFLPLSMIGFGLDDFFVVHIFTLAIGHLNHSNVYLPLGPLKYVLNNPQMHIWHHAKQLPEGYKYGANFGLTLSIWDYLFGYAYVPHSGRDIALGFEDVEHFPDNFVAQSLYPFKNEAGK